MRYSFLPVVILLLPGCRQKQYPAIVLQTGFGTKDGTMKCYAQ
jgi:hypothetical protein